MTTHVFIVDDNTFKYHLEYMFAGTGADEKEVDFNNSKTSALHHSTEAGLVAMMADGARVRKNDLIIFYLQSSGEHEGLFFGVFQATENGSLTYDYANSSIVTTKGKFHYTGRYEEINILPRLIEKYNNWKAHETHLQMYITQNLGLGINKTLDGVLEVRNKNIEWIGNEVSCGVGMQRIDIMFSISESETKRILCPIELKAIPAYEDNTRQLTRYIDWIEQYYIPN